MAPMELHRILEGHVLLEENLWWVPGGKRTQSLEFFLNTQIAVWDQDHCKWEGTHFVGH